LHIRKVALTHRCCVDDPGGDWFSVQQARKPACPSTYYSSGPRAIAEFLPGLSKESAAFYIIRAHRFFHLDATNRRPNIRTWTLIQLREVPHAAASSGGNLLVTWSATCRRHAFVQHPWGCRMAPGLQTERFAFFVRERESIL